MKRVILVVAMCVATFLSACSDDSPAKVVNTPDVGNDAQQNDTSSNDVSTSDDVSVSDDVGGQNDGGGDVGDDVGEGAVCGNMVVEEGETCDPPQLCPTTCDDNNACTVDALAGEPGMCTSECSNTPIEVCANDDGCCAPGCNEQNDNDCAPFCGNDVTETGELCDGDCPVACDDQDACTSDTLVGQNCNVECNYDAITVCDLTSDGCCPPTCNANNDADCMPVCTNGVVENGELCDGNCPVACDDGVACTDNVLSGAAATCDAVCSYPAITVCDLNVSDNCCPSVCNGTTDVDCQAVCGNGVIESGETCDPVAMCPTSCDDGIACTTDTLSGSAATCDAACSNIPITVCSLAPDGCCPTICNANNDADCPAVCGNNVIEAGETCDPINTCPSVCDDGDVCTSDVLSGNPATCTSECTSTAITACTDNDGCCPAVCNAMNDSDCVATPTAFRIDSLQLRDPHPYALVLGLFCIDIVGNLNTELNNANGGDADGDGFLDLSLLAVQRPSDPGAVVATPMDIGEGNCTAPAASTSCDLAPNPGSTTYTNQLMGTCLSPVAATTSGYSPAITEPSGPCFVSGTTALTLDLGGILIPLSDLQIGSTWNGNPATGLLNGLLMGFISETDAENVIIPASIPQVGGQTLASLFPGGTGNCDGGDDRDTGPDGVTQGWWVYFNFTATEVTYTGM